MPVLDGNFEAFVTNLGKYNEGMLVGEWVKLPTTEEEMQKVFERIEIGKQDEFGQPYEEWFIGSSLQRLRSRRSAALRRSTKERLICEQKSEMAAGVVVLHRRQRTPEV